MLPASRVLIASAQAALEHMTWSEVHLLCLQHPSGLILASTHMWLQGRARALSVDGSRRVEQQSSRKKDAGAARPARDAPDMLETSHETLMQVRTSCRNPR